MPRWLFLRNTHEIPGGTWQILLLPLSLGHRWFYSHRSVVGQCLEALLDVQQNRLRFRKRDLSEHPSMLGEGAGSGLACGSEHPQPGILGALEKGIKVTGLWLLPSPPLLLSFLFLLLPLLSFPSSCCSLPVSHAMGSVLLVIRGANVVQQPTCKHQDRVAEPLSLPNPAHCEQPTSLSHPGPLLLLLSQKRDRRLPRMMHNEEQRLF